MNFYFNYKKTEIFTLKKKKLNFSVQCFQFTWYDNTCKKFDLVELNSTQENGTNWNLFLGRDVTAEDPGSWLCCICTSCCCSCFGCFYQFYWCSVRFSCCYPQCSSFCISIVVEFHIFLLLLLQLLQLLLLLSVATTTPTTSSHSFSFS